MHRSEDVADKLKIEYSWENEVIAEFYLAVCERAERKMLVTGKLEGSHYAAMQEIIRERGIEITPEEGDDRGRKDSRRSREDDGMHGATGAAGGTQPRGSGRVADAVDPREAVLRNFAGAVLEYDAPEWAVAECIARLDAADPIRTLWPEVVLLLKEARPPGSRSSHVDAIAKMARRWEKRRSDLLARIREVEGGET